MTRTHTIALATLCSLVLGATSRVHADAPVGCAPARSAKIADGPRGLRITATASAGLNPMANGLVLELATEPETAADAIVLHVELPPEGFTSAGGAFLYEDPTGSVQGVTEVRLRARKGGTKIAVRTNASALPTSLDAPLRVIVQTAASCARSCPANCRRTKRGALKCKRSQQDPLCGLASGCEPFGLDAAGTSRACLLPYPSNFFTTPDAAAETGRRLAYERRALPANASGTHIDPAPYDLLDGFSPGPVVTTHFPAGVDLIASQVPSPATLGASIDPASPTLLIEADASGCVRVPHFAENDVSADVDGEPVAPPDQVFMLRPGVRLKNGTRYLVALRDLVDQTGMPIEPGPAFRVLRDGGKTKLPALLARRAALEADLAKLESDCGVVRDDLVLAWDFTTASDDSIQRYLLHMRDETFAELDGSAAPAFVVDTVENDPLGDPRICRRVRGTYSVPLYTTFNGPGSVLNIDPDTNLPVRNGTASDIPFTAVIPCSLVGPTPQGGRPVVYGHGLLGSGDGEITAGNLRTLANTYGFVLAATDWQGFSEHDLPVILGFLGDLSGFTKLSERLHQGVLNMLVLGRLMGSPAGFASHPAFQQDGMPLIDTQAVYWYGISQGGIEGGVVMALAQDITRGILGVPAANYSTLLHRSRDFEPFFLGLKIFYPSAIDRALLLGLIQQLWDRSEPNGWYHHTLPGSLPDTPEHEILVHMARSDAEVANLGTTIMVRSMGMPQLPPVNESYYAIPEQAAPFDGSAFIESDFGLGDPPITNTPPEDNDVHGQMRALPAIQAQIDRFLRPDGRVEQFCTGPCDPD